MSRAKLLITGVSVLLLLIVATGGVAAADVDVDASPTDWNVNSVHTIEFSVDNNDAVAGESLENIVIEYQVGSAQPASTGNVGQGDIDWIGIDRGDNNVGTRVDQKASVKEVTGEGSGSRLYINTQGNLQIEAGDEVVAVYKEVQNPQRQDVTADYPVNVTVNRNGGASVAQGSITYEFNNASTTFSDQETNGDTITVDRVSLDEAGYVVVLNGSQQGQNRGEFRGASEYLPAGEHRDVSVDLTPDAVDETVVAQAHIDTNRNQRFDWLEGEQYVDTKYEEDGGGDIQESAWDSADLTLSPATFALSNLSPSSKTITEGETTEDISVDVENTGGKSGQQDLNLSITGTQVSSTEGGISLESGGSDTITFNSVDTSGLEPGEYSYEISSDDDTTQSGTLTINELPTYEVTLNRTEITETTDTDTIDISADIENTGDLSGEQDIDFTVSNDSGTQISKTNGGVSRASGESDSVTFSADISDLEPGDYAYTIASDNESKSGELGIREASDGPNFQIEGLSDRTVKEDRNSIDISVDVTNIGEQSGSQTVALTIGGGEPTDKKQVSRTPGETDSVTFNSVDISSLGPNSYTLEVNSSDEVDTKTLTIEALEPANFELSNIDPSSAQVKEGQSPIDVSVDVENTGDKSDQQSLELSVIGTDLPKETDTVNLGAGGSKTAEFSDVDMGSLDPGTYTLEVSSNDNKLTKDLSVEEVTSPYFELSNLVEPTVRDDADSVSISADVQNIGDGDGTRNIKLSLTGSNNPSKSKSVDAGEGKDVTFNNVDVSSLGPGEYTYSIDSGDETKSATLSVVEAQNKPNFVVEDVPDRTVSEDKGSVDISVDVTNYGDQSGSQTVNLSVGDQGPTVEREVSRDPDETNDVTFSGVDISDLNPGSYTLEVSSEDSTATGSLTVEAIDSVPATFELVSVDPAEPTITEGEKIEKLAADIENTGDETGDQRIQLNVTDKSGAERLVTNQTIDIDGAEVETVEFNDVAVDGLEPGDYTYTVASRDDTISGTLTVEEDEGLDGGSGGYSGGSTSSSDESDESDASDTADADDQDIPESTLDYDTQPFEDQEPRSLGFNIEFDNTVLVEEITFEELGEGSVTVAKLSGVPDDVEEPGAAVLETMNIDPPSSVEDDPATVSFTLNEAQLDNVDSVQLSRWTGSEWEHYDAERVESDDGEPTFGADVEGFSTFAVTTTDSQDEATDETGSESGSEDDSTDETRSGNDDATDETASTDTPEEPVEAGSLGGAAPAIGIIVLILVVSAAAVAAARESGQV